MALPRKPTKLITFFLLCVLSGDLISLTPIFLFVMSNNNVFLCLQQYLCSASEYCSVVHKHLLFYG